MIEGTFAELQFRLADGVWALGDHEGARAAYLLVRHQRIASVAATGKGGRYRPRGRGAGHAGPQPARRAGEDCFGGTFTTTLRAATLDTTRTQVRFDEGTDPSRFALQNRYVVIFTMH